MQERQPTERMSSLITHDNDDYFVINLHALHNASLIRKVLPRVLTAPKALYADRRSRHYEIAAELRVSQAKKREVSKAKAKATRLANKSKEKGKSKALDPLLEADDEDVEDDMENRGDMDSNENDLHSVPPSRKRRRVIDASV